MPVDFKYVPTVKSVVDIPIFKNSLYNLDFDNTLVYPLDNSVRLCNPRIPDWLQKVVQNGNVIDIITARPETSLQRTLEELARLNIPYRRLYMRLDKGNATLESYGNDKYEFQIFADDQCPFLEDVILTNPFAQVYRVLV